jgi:hypothetical protein
MIPGVDNPNMLRQTENITVLPWQFFNVSGTATRVGDTLEFGASGSDRLTQPSIRVEATAYTFSVTLSGSGSVRLIIFGGDGGTGGAAIVVLTGTPTRYSVTKTTVAGVQGGVGIYNNAAGTPSTAVVADPQLELGSTASAYQPRV